jgi:hypothetical protein
MPQSDFAGRLYAIDGRAAMQMKAQERKADSTIPLGVWIVKRNTRKMRQKSMSPNGSGFDADSSVNFKVISTWTCFWTGPVNIPTKERRAQYDAGVLQESKAALPQQIQP